LPLNKVEPHPCLILVEVVELAPEQGGAPFIQNSFWSLQRCRNLPLKQVVDVAPLKSERRDCTVLHSGLVTDLKSTRAAWTHPTGSYFGLSLDESGEFHLPKSQVTGHLICLNVDGVQRMATLTHPGSICFAFCKLYARQFGRSSNLFRWSPPLSCTVYSGL